MTLKVAYDCETRAELDKTRTRVVKMKTKESKDKKSNLTQTLDQVIQKTLIQKLLIVNDDAEDILAIQSRLPDCIDTYAASQWQARNIVSDARISDGPGPDAGYLFDLIILDNDANNANESKGRETLQKIRENYPEVPVIYTSFEPGWVAEDVKNTKGVEVVKTNLVLKYLAEKYNLAIKRKKRSTSKGVVSKKTNQNPKVNLIITYNEVSGYKAGIYNNGELIIVSYTKSAMEQAKAVVKGYVERLYKEFNFRQDRDIIKNVFVYDGLNGGEWPGRLASALEHDIRMPIHLMACGCEWDRKQNLAYNRAIKLYKVHCGGQDELGAIADMILGIKRPGKKYPPLDSELGRAIRFGTPKFEF